MPKFGLLSFIKKPAKEKQGIPEKPVGLLLLLTFLAVIAVVFSAKQWIETLKVPFLIPESERVDTTKLSLDTEELSNFLLLKATDTDLDSLSDYDEMYLYKTSPYLEDSDSDQISDSQEISQNSDPNCPEGSECSTPASQPTNQPAQTNLEYLANLTPEQLRSLLIQRGVPADEVNKMDDQTLRSTYLETLESISPTDSFSNLITNTEIDLSAAQIRELLLSQGVTQGELDKLSDEELLMLWQETVRQLQQTGTISPGP